MPHNPPDNLPIVEMPGNALPAGPSLPIMDVPLTIPKPPTKLNARMLVIPVVIFAAVFGLILVLLNLPATTKSVNYAVTHTDDKDNQQLTEQYRSLYGYQNHPELNGGALAATPAPASTNTAAAQNTGSFSLSVPKLAISAPVLTVPTGTDADILASLKKGVVLYPGAAYPGDSGTTVIIGHSSSLPPWTQYSAIFAKLGSLAPDDLIYLTFDGKEYIYRVSGVRRGSVQDILNSGMTGDLILSTCWPVGTDTNRVAVSGMLVK